MDEILRTKYSELKNTKIIKASDLVYKDGNKVIRLIYESKGGIRYEGMMLTNFDTFIFQ